LQIKHLSVSFGIKQFPEEVTEITKLLKKLKEKSGHQEKLIFS
jgi:hypothetical protein